MKPALNDPQKTSPSRTAWIRGADHNVTLVDQVAVSIKHLDQVGSSGNATDEDSDVMTTHASARVTHVFLKKIETVIGLLNLGLDLSTAVVLSISVQNANGVVEGTEDDRPGSRCLDYLPEAVCAATIKRLEIKDCRTVCRDFLVFFTGNERQEYKQNQANPVLHRSFSSQAGSTFTLNQHQLHDLNIVQTNILSIETFLLPCRRIGVGIHPVGSTHRFP